MAASLIIRRVTNAPDWEVVVRIRSVVFIDEQACPPADEWDEFDAPAARFSSCHHFIGEVAGQAVAVARWHPDSVEGRPAAKLERFAVLPEARGSGYGRALIAHLINDSKACGFSLQVLHAQVYLETLYTSFGFERVGNVFDEVGIPHVKMVSIDGR